MNNTKFQPMTLDQDEPGSNMIEGSSKKRGSKQKVKRIRIVVGVLLLAFVAVVAAVAVLKWIPNRKTQMNIDGEEKGASQGILFRGIFSTNYVWGNTSGTPSIMNAAEIADELNENLVETSVQIMNALLISNSATNRQFRKKCEKKLPGYYLQMIISASSSQCEKQNDQDCKTQLQKELHTLFHDLTSTTINVQFDKNTTNVLTIKLCSLTEIDDDVEETSQIRQKAASVEISPKQARLASINDNGRIARCALCINRLRNVRMNGEYGTRINDDATVGSIFDEDRYRTERSATVLETTNYQLFVHLDCGNQWSNPCSRSLTVTGWIDYNNNGYDDGESFVLRPAWVDRDIPNGEYIADIRVPKIDGKYVKPGTHTMRITVAASAEYQRECGIIGYQESREYTINVVAIIPATTTPVYIPPSPICNLPFPKIILVIMAGEKGTEIRDDLPRTRPLSLYENEHHQAVTLFENTVYLIRIQLDCSTQLSTDLTRTGCNLAQDVFIAIDRNDDGKFDSSELGTPYRWPVTSYMVQGIYDLQLYVPAIQDLYKKGDKHRMRILVLPSDYYVRNCGFSLYNETREYEVKIIPIARRTVITDVDRPSLIPRDYQCSSDVSKILLVVMAGEYRTQIRDDPATQEAALVDPAHERHSAITLYEDNVYLLRIQLECRSNRGKEYARVNCSLPHDVSAWIDLDDDGIFDESENAAPYRWPIASYIPEGVYDLQIYVPSLDSKTVRSGPHTLRLEVTLNEDYRSKCDNNYYRETRDYNITIVRYKVPDNEIGISYLKLSDDVCSQTNSKVVLVIMTGELGTHIRDDTALKTIVRETQNRHHLGVTLYENTIYRIRIQLDCDQSSSRSTYHQRCNLAQDVNVLIDFNNDGVFDDSESRVPDRWPLHTSAGLGIYDLDIAIPVIGDHGLRGGNHRMRIVVKSSYEYIDKCGSSSEYQESREYSVNVISRVSSYRGK